MIIPTFLLIHDVQLKRYKGTSAHGPVYEDPTREKMRIERKQTKQIDEKGVEFVSNAFAIAAPTTNVNINDIVIYNGREYTVKNWLPMDTHAGTHHIEMVLV